MRPYLALTLALALVPAVTLAQGPVGASATALTAVYRPDGAETCHDARGPILGPAVAECGPATIPAQAYGLADLGGVLRTFAGGSAMAEASATWQDVLTLTGPVAPRLVVFDLAESGWLSASATSISAPAIATFSSLLSVGAGGPCLNDAFHAGRTALGGHPPNVDVRRTVTCPVVGGSVAFTYRNAVSASATIFPPRPGYPGAASRAEADFRSTGRLVGLRVLDASGADVTSLFTVTAASGVTYAIVPTPEPGTWALVGAGLVVSGLAAAGRRKRRP